MTHAHWQWKGGKEKHVGKQHVSTTLKSAEGGDAPVVYITKTALAELYLLHLSQHIDEVPSQEKTYTGWGLNEVAGWAGIKRREDGSYVISNVVAAYVGEHADVTTPAAANKAARAKLRALGYAISEIIHIHTHPGMGCFWSPTDTDDHQKLLDGRVVLGLEEGELLVCVADLTSQEPTLLVRRYCWSGGATAMPQHKDSKCVLALDDNGNVMLRLNSGRPAHAANTSKHLAYGSGGYADGPTAFTKYKKYHSPKEAAAAARFDTVDSEGIEWWIIEDTKDPDVGMPFYIVQFGKIKVVGSGHFQDAYERIFENQADPTSKGARRLRKSQNQGGL